MLLLLEIEMKKRKIHETWNCSVLKTCFALFFDNKTFFLLMWEKLGQLPFGLLDIPVFRGNISVIVQFSGQRQFQKLTTKINDSYFN